MQRTPATRLDMQRPPAPRLDMPRPASDTRIGQPNGDAWAPHDFDQTTCVSYDHHSLGPPYPGSEKRYRTDRSRNVYANAPYNMI